MRHPQVLPAAALAAAMCSWTASLTVEGAEPGHGRVATADGTVPFAEWLAQLRSADADERAKAAESLVGEISRRSIRGRPLPDPYRRLLGPMAKALKDPDERVRTWAARALGRLAGPQGVDPLAAALKDSAVPVRRAAAAALGELALRGQGIAPALELLVSALKDSDERVRHHAADALAASGEAEAAGPLLACLKPGSGINRCVVLQCLGRLAVRGVQDRRVLRALAEGLQDSDAKVRAAACRYVGLLGGRRAVPRLLRIMQSDADEGVRAAAAKTVCLIGMRASPDSSGVIGIPEKVHAGLVRLRVDETFSARQLDEVLERLDESLSQVSEMTLVADWKALSGAGVRPETPVTADLSDVPMGAALWAVLDPLDDGGRLAWRCRGDTVVVGTVTGLESLAKVPRWSVVGSPGAWAARTMSHRVPEVRLDAAPLRGVLLFLDHQVGRDYDLHACWHGLKAAGLKPDRDVALRLGARRLGDVLDALLLRLGVRQKVAVLVRDRLILIVARERAAVWRAALQAASPVAEDDPDARRVLAQPIDLSLDGVPLKAALQLVGESAAGPEMRTHWRALRRAGARAREPVTFRFRRLPAHTCLRLLLLEAGVERPVLSLRGGRLHITAAER